MEVWIDQHLCTGGGVCEEICPEVFVVLREDGLAYVKNPEDETVQRDNDGRPLLRGQDGTVAIAVELMDRVIEAAQECPSDCIFIEHD